MTKQFVILCSAQRLEYQDGNDGTIDYYAFGMNLTAAIGLSPGETPSVTPEAAAALRLWRWTRITQVQATITPDDGSKSFSCDVIPLRATPDLDLDTLRKELDKEFDPTSSHEDLKTVTVWRLPEAQGIEKKVALDFNIKDEERRKKYRLWHSSILQLSTYPYPIPQLLNLSFIVKVPKSKFPTAAEKTGQLFLAPIIPDTTFFAAPTKPQGRVEPTSDTRGVFRWKYDNPTKTGLEVAAYILRSQVEDDPALLQTGFMDMKIGWIKKTDTFEEDWRSYFEKRAGEVFDLAERLIDYLRDHVADLQKIDTAPPPPMGELAHVPFLQKIIIGVMRDLAGAGLLPSASIRTVRDPGPPPIIEGITLADDLFRQATGRYLQKAEIELLRAKEKELFGDDIKWRAFLAANLPQVSELKVLKILNLPSTPSASPTPIPTPSPTPTPTPVQKPPKPLTEEVPQSAEDCLSELEQLHKALLDPENLHTIVQKQWEKIFEEFEKAGSVPDWVSTLRKQITALKSDFDYRSRLASGNLGPVWNALRKQANANKGTNLDLKALIQPLLINHLKARLSLTPTEAPAVDPLEYQNYFPKLTDPQKLQIKCGAGALTLLIDCVIADLRQVDPKTGASKIEKLAQSVSATPADSAEKATDVPHSISLQAHPTTMLPDQQAAFDDVLNQISGVLVFLRDQTEHKWYCLNYAVANVRSSALQKTNLITVPSRINYQNEMTQSLITYNNVPLVARSPLARIPEAFGYALAGAGQALVNGTGTSELQSLITYDYSKDSNAKIKALVFRDKSKMYDAALCVVSASGALPKDIASSANPWVVDPVKLSALNLAADYLRSFTYMRKVRVGQLRSKSYLEERKKPDTKANDGNPLNLPKIPDGVYPRALEMPPELPSPQDPDDRPRRLADKLPLLVLAPADKWTIKTKFEFKLRKPATDVETWHRWVHNNSNQAARIAVLKDYYKTSEANRVLSKELTPTDVSFDDHAVRGFYAELFRFNPDAPPNTNHWAKAGVLRQIELPPNPSPASLKDVQRESITVVCQSSGSEGISPLAGGKLPVECLEGHIYWLRIRAFILSDDAKKFADSVANDFQDTDPASNIKLTSPFEMLVEVATDKLPLEHEVWQSLTPRFLSQDRSLPPRFFVDDAGGDRVQVSIESNVPNFRHVHRAELQRQTWYWQGRDTREFPALPAPTYDFVDPDLLDPRSPPSGFGLSEDMALWEKFEFAGRNELDFTILDFKRAPELDTNSLMSGSAMTSGGATPPKIWFTYAEQLTPETDNTQLSKGGKEKSEKLVLEASQKQTSDGSNEKGDLRAHYYRFSAEVFSRYEGAFPEGVARSKRAKNPQSNIKAKDAKWRRLFVPCRRKEPPPVPKIKLILPLTESFMEHDVTRSPGLLVLLNEPWYEWGGLGEGLIAEVETLADPHNMPGGEKDPCPIPGQIPGQKFYFELGPDPILLKKDAAAIKSRLLLPKSDTVNTAAVSTVSLERIRGPVGHTHDEKDEGALFTATSFIVPAPKVKNQETELTDLSWYMCKIRLLRRMRLKGSASKDSSAVLQSKATEPQWVQYLPEFSLFSCDRTVADLYISVGNTEVTIHNNNDNSLVTHAELSGPVERESPVFTPVLLLTRAAFNASGERNQEVYVGFCWPNADKKTWSMLPELPGGSNTTLKDMLTNKERKEIHFQGRILGVQDVRLGSATPAAPFTPPASSKDFCDSLFAYNERDERDENGKPTTQAISDAQRPRVVRISQPISDVRDPAKGKTCTAKAALASPPPAPGRRR